MKIEVNKDGVVFKDDVEVTKDDITTDFLENVTKESLAGNVEYELVDDLTIPTVKLFNDIKELCSEDSEFHKKIMKIREDKAKVEENSDISNIANKEIEEFNTEVEEDIPF